MIRFRRGALIFTAIILLSISGCRQGRDVHISNIPINSTPERIVALAPSIVEVLYKLGLGDKIVAVADDCDYPVEAREKARVGNSNGIDMERIVELNPDIVLAGNGISEEACTMLRNFGINVAIAEARTVEEIPGSFMLIGKITGTDEKACMLADEIMTRINNIRVIAKGAGKVRTYYAISYGREGNWTCGKGTFISELIDIAGGKNIADDVENWKEYSMEKIIERNPDFILLSAAAAWGNEDTLDNEKGYREVNAVKNNRVVIVDDSLTQRPGPRIADGLEQIAKAIHPELFGR